MREYYTKPQNRTHVLDGKSKAPRQAPINVILQQRKKQNIQRYVVEEDKDLIQGKFDAVQRGEIDKDELLQDKFKSVPTNEQESIQGEEKVNDTGLPDKLKMSVENLSGYSMDDVKVHYNSDKPAQLNALAYAQGTDIHIAPGQEQHLPHETWHVVQQKQGRVQPTMQLQGINVNDNEGLEKEADIMEKSLDSGSGKEILSKNSSVGVCSTVTQRRIRFVPESVEPDSTFTKAWLLQTGKELRDIENTCLNLMIQDDVKREYRLLYGQEEFLKDLHTYTMLFKSPLGSEYDQYIGEIPRIEIIPKDDEDYQRIIDTAGGAHYDPKSGVIFFCEGFFCRRTLLHELGHFKQQKDLGMTGEEFFEFYSQNKKLVEYHNVMNHENLFDVKNEESVTEVQGEERKKLYDQSGKRVMYSKDGAGEFAVRKDKSDEVWGNLKLKGLEKKVSEVTKKDMLDYYPQYDSPQKYHLYEETMNTIFNYDEKLRYQTLYFFCKENFF